MNFLLLLSIPLLNALCQTFRKFYNNYTEHLTSPISIFLMLNSIASVLFYYISSGFEFDINLITLVYSIALALLVAANNILSMKLLDRTDVSTVCVFTGAGGIVLPYLFGVLALNESVNAFKVISVLILLSIVLLPVLKSRPKGEKKDAKTYIMLVCVFFITGANSILCKTHQINPNTVSGDMFYMWANAWLIPFSFAFAWKTAGLKNFFSDFKTCGSKGYLMGIVVILTSAVASVFSLQAFDKFDLSFYTISNNSLFLIMTTALSFLLLRQRPTKSTLINVGLSIIAIVLYNI